MSEPQGSPCPGEPAAENNGTAPREILVPHRQKREIIPVHNARVALLDTAKFDHMWRVATAMTETGMVPDSICKVTRKGKDGQDDTVVDLPDRTVIARCFKIVNVADRWSFDPFMLLDCVSLIHNKMCYEGKVIHAAIEQCLDVRLKYDFNEGKGRQLGVTVSGQFENEKEPRTIFGTVDDWHTGAKSPWHAEGNWKRQLRYRGAREWCRAHAPGILLGVYGDDEFDRDEPVRAPQVLRVEVIDVPPPPPPPEESINQEPAQPTESESTQDPPPPPPKPRPVKGEKPAPTMTLKRSAGK